MKIKLAFVAITAATLAMVGCQEGQPSDYPRPVTVEPSPSGLPPCASEDAPGPCVWDAGADGNGEGRSFVVDDDGIVHPLP